MPKSSSSIIRLPLCAILLPNRDLSFESVQSHRKVFEKKYLTEPTTNVSNHPEDILSSIDENLSNTHTSATTQTLEDDENTSNIIEDEEVDNISEGLSGDCQNHIQIAFDDVNSVISQSGVPINSPQSPSNLSSPSSPISISQLSSSPSTPNNLLSRKSSGNIKQLSKPANDVLLTNIEVLRNKYLEYLLENNALKVPNVVGRYEMFLTFMDYVYDPIQRKPSSYITDFNQLLKVMDAFCQSSLYLMGTNEEIDWVRSEYESIKVESKTGTLSKDNELPFLQYFVKQIIPKRAQGGAYKWFCHARLSQLLEKVYKLHKNKQSFTFTKVEQSSTESASTNPSKENQSNQGNEVALMDEVQLICDMLYTILEDTFVLFQHKQYKFVKKWTEKGIKNNTLPRFLIECYKKKNEYNQAMQSEYKLTIDDLSMKHVIDKDWKYAKYLCKEYSSDWFLTYVDKGRVAQWASDNDYSEGLQLRLSKNVGVFEYPIESVAKSLHFDNHLDYTFSNLKYSNYSSIDFSNSMKKYPSVLLNADLVLGPLFSPRGFNVICSTQAKFVGEELTESYTLFKSCDMNSSNTSEKVKFPYVGLRVLTKIDNNRTRYVELRMGNAGGIVSAKKITFSSMISKKLCSENYNGLLNCVKSCEKTNFQPPKSSEQFLVRTLSEYCKKYCNIDLDERWK